MSLRERSLAGTVVCALLVGCSSSSTSPTPDAPTAPVLDRSKLGAPCASDASGCPSGSHCWDFSFVAKDLTEPRCVEGDACALVTCPSSQRCVVLTKRPGAPTCNAAGPPAQ